MTGGIGRRELTDFYTHHFIFANPPDTELELISRTVGVDRVVDEFIFKVSHMSEIDWLSVFLYFFFGHSLFVNTY
jgi:carboxymethylenebutenolidase